jgi:hypothetical protein
MDDDGSLDSNWVQVSSILGRYFLTLFFFFSLGWAPPSWVLLSLCDLIPLNLGF